MSMSIEETGLLGRLAIIKTPDIKESGVIYNEDYDDLCKDYCDIRNLAKDCLRGDVSFEEAREKIDIFLKKYEPKLENAMG